MRSLGFRSLALVASLAALAGCTSSVADGADSDEASAPSSEPKPGADKESAEDRPTLELGRAHVTAVDNPGQTP